MNKELADVLYQEGGVYCFSHCIFAEILLLHVCEHITLLNNLIEQNIYFCQLKILDSNELDMTKTVNLANNFIGYFTKNQINKQRNKKQQSNELFDNNQLDNLTVGGVLQKFIICLCCFFKKH